MRRYQFIFHLSTGKYTVTFDTFTDEFVVFYLLARLVCLGYMAHYTLVYSCYM